MDRKHAGNAPQASAHKIEQVGSRSYLSDHHSNKNTEDEKDTNEDDIANVDHLREDFR
jgi:hypothetical protein